MERSISLEILPEVTNDEMIQQIRGIYYLWVFDRQPAAQGILLMVLTQVIYLLDQSFSIL